MFKGLSISVFFFLFTGCFGNGDLGGTGGAPGPIDGSWNLTSLTCNGSSNNLGGETQVLAVQGTAATQTGNLGSCQQTTPLTLEFLTSATLAAAAGNTSCSSGCNPSCGTATPLPRLEYTYSVLGGSTLTWTRTAATAGEDCPVGQTIVRHYSKATSLRLR